MNKEKLEIKKLFKKCCVHLVNGDTQMVYREVLPLLTKLSQNNEEPSEEIQSLMAACAMLDANRQGVVLQGANIVTITS